MTGRENDLLNEIYFVQSFENLALELGWEDDVILETLLSLHSKGWIRCYTTPSDEVMTEEINLKGNFKKYLYLASKKGLFAHNSTE
jgi:hypothetical protein